MTTPSEWAQGLRPASEIAPGAFLTPPQYKRVYTETRFNQEMGRVANEIATRIGARTTAWTVADLRAHLEVIAGVRRALGGKAGVSYGMPTPSSADEVYEPHRHEAMWIPREHRAVWCERVFRLWGMLRDFLAKDSQIDRALVSGVSHRAVMTADPPPGSWCHLEIDHEQLGLTVLVEEPAGFVLSHPSYARMARVREVAYERLARALDSEPPDLDGVARAYQLCIHATPWLNGTAAILETFIDALLRAHGWALPAKTSEPYFDAVFHRGVYTWRDLASNFDGSPKPLVYQEL